MAELTEAIKRVALVADRGAQVRLEFSEDRVRLSAGADDVGRAEEDLQVDFAGEPLTIAFNPQFLVEGIESVGSEELAVQLSSPLRPGLLRPVDGDDFSYLVMPIRLNA